MAGGEAEANAVVMHQKNGQARKEHEIEAEKNSNSNKKVWRPASSEELCDHLRSGASLMVTRAVLMAATDARV